MAIGVLPPSFADRRPAMRRRHLGAAVLAALASAVLCLPGAALASTRGSWDRADQRAVVRARLLGDQPGGFHGERSVAPVQLRGALRALGARLGTGPVAFSGTDVTVARFDAALVAQLGLADLARSVQAEARGAGLRPPARFGTEVVARQLRLRYNHPASDDRLELYPWDRITRAEAAYSLARVLELGGWETSYAREVLGRFRLPRYTAAQLAPLRIAVSKIGMPYVWAGETDRASSTYGYQAHGGYDCSGFVWRVYKLSGLAAGRRIGGRSAAAIAGEVPRSRRIRFGRVQPGDLLFFGAALFGGRATEAGIIHTGIALSREFMIHSSSQGVYVSPLFEDWRRAESAWARRVL